MRKAFRGQFWGKLWRSKRLPPSLPTQVQTDKCYRETENDAFMCDSIVHVYRYTVILSYTVTFQRLELFYILHRRLGFLHHVQESRQCIFAALCFLQINPRVCCYQIELVRLNWVVRKIKLFFFSQVNKLHCFFCFCFLSLKKTWRYSWEKQEVQFLFWSTDSYLIFLSLMVKSVHNIHIQNHFGQVCTP